MLNKFKHFKLILLAVFYLLIVAFSHNKILAASKDNPDYSGQIIHFFGSRTCPHCAEEKEWMIALKSTHPELKIYYYEIGFSQNSQLLLAVANKLEVSGQGVPFTVIGDQVTIGFSLASSGQIYQMLTDSVGVEDLVVQTIKEQQLVPITNELQAKVTADESVGQQRDEAKESDAKAATEPESGDNNILDLPVFGRVDAKEVSLPILTVMIALVDGFNPCAMWVLMFLISLLLGMQDRKRMWLLGISFIVASAIVYFLFMAAWLNLFLFLGLLTWVRIVIGLLALFAAYSYLKDYFKNKDGACEVDLGGKKQRIFESLQAVTKRESLIWALLGTIGLAFAVNILELVCSAGLPAVYTQLLSLSGLSSAQYYLYLALYILIFMLDDIVVFIIAMVTMKAVGLHGKYARYSHLIGGVIMLLIGLAMLFKPELIMFF